MDRPQHRSTAPFLACLALGLLVMLAPQYDARPGHAILAGILVVLSGLATAHVVRRRHASWVDAAPVGFMWPALAVIFDGTGGTASPLVPLVAVPVVWTALYGSRRALVLCGGVVFLVLFSPLLLIGGAAYPWESAARPVLWTGIALLLGPAVQHAVRQWHRERDQQHRLTAELRTVLEGSRLAALTTVDVDGTLRTFGSGAERLLGHRGRALVGRQSMLMLHDPVEVEQVALELGVEPGFEVFAELARREAEARYWTYLRRDGQRLVVKLAVTELRDGTGETSGYLAVAIDSTEQMARRAEAERAQRSWQFVVDHLPDTALFTLDEDLRIGQVAGTGALSVGLRGAQGRDFADFSSPANLAVMREMVRAAASGEVLTRDMVSTANGRAQEVLATRLWDEDDTPGDLGAEAPREVLILARDVSRERRRAAVTARERDRAEQMFTRAPLGIFLLDRAGRILQANPAACALIRVVEGDLVGRRVDSLAEPDAPDLSSHWRRPLDAGEVRTRWEVRRQDGELLHLDVSSSRMLMPVAACAAEEDRGGEATGCQPLVQEVVLMHLVDVTAAERYQTQLAYWASHDMLTGLANRRHFETTLGHHLDGCRRYGARGAVLMLDLDHFKAVNDTMGHAAGDELLVSLAGVLSARLRSTDVVARLGGDEFAVLLPEGDRATALGVGRELVQAVQARVATLSGAQRQVTVSIGAVQVADADLTVTDLLTAADSMLYAAKESGRGRVVLLGAAPESCLARGA